MKKPVLIAALILAGCQGAEAELTQKDLARDWALVRMNGTDAPAKITMDLTEPGRAAGQAPCNRWFGGVEGTLPEFRLPAVGATRMACPEMEAESAFLAALAKIGTARLEGESLILSGEGDVMLEFLPIKP